MKPVADAHRSLVGSEYDFRSDHRSTGACATHHRFIARNSTKAKFTHGRRRG